MSIQHNIPNRYLSSDFIEKLNQVYHDLEAKHYDTSHPEIFRREQLRWKKLLDATEFSEDEELSVLDVGTGTGFAAYQVLSRFSKAKVKCIDISERMLMLAKEKLTRTFPEAEIEFELKSAVQNEFGTDKYDLIIINSVLHHLPQPFMTIRNLSYSLVKGGFFILAHEPNYRFFSNNTLISWTRRMQYLRSFWRRFLNPSRYMKKLFGICKLISPKQTQDLASKTFAKLQTKGIITQNDHFKLSWIGALVDLHIPRIRSGIKPGLTGFNLFDLVNNISYGTDIKFVEYYDFLADESNRSIFHKILNYYLSLRYPGCGAHFAAVIQRPF